MLRKRWVLEKQYCYLKVVDDLLPFVFNHLSYIVSGHCVWDLTLHIEYVFCGSILFEERLVFAFKCWKFTQLDQAHNDDDFHSMQCLNQLSMNPKQNGAGTRWPYSPFPIGQCYFLLVSRPCNWKLVSRILLVWLLQTSKFQVIVS